MAAQQSLPYERGPMWHNGTGVKVSGIHNSSAGAGEGGERCAMLA